jgi:hypothetical protein
MSDTAASVRKATDDLSLLVLNVYNEKSIGLWRIQENIRRKVPEIVSSRFVPLSLSLFDGLERVWKRWGRGWRERMWIWRRAERLSRG